jgi:hypothetical protein
VSWALKTAPEDGALGLWDADHGPEELLLADGALVGARVDEAGEVLAERADAGEVALGDLAGWLSEAAVVPGRELARRAPGRRRLDRNGGRAGGLVGGAGGHVGSWGRWWPVAVV